MGTAAQISVCVRKIGRHTLTISSPSGAVRLKIEHEREPPAIVSPAPQTQAAEGEDRECLEDVRRSPVSHPP